MTYDDDYYDAEWEEMQPHEDCPRCGRWYGHVDFDFQFCSKCGWDAEAKKYDFKGKVEPTDEDYMNGDADFLTGRWY